MRSYSNILPIFGLLLALLLVSCESSTTPLVVSNPKLSFTPSASTITVGEEISISLEIENLPQAVFGMSFHISYDDNVISFADSVGMENGDFFSQEAISFVNGSNSIIRVSFTQIRGQEAVSGSGLIAIFTFTGISHGTGNIIVSRDQLHFYDSEGNVILIPNIELNTVTITVQ